MYLSTWPQTTALKVLCVWVFAFMYVYVPGAPERSGEGVGSRDTGVKNYYKSPYGAGKQTQILCKSHKCY